MLLLFRRTCIMTIIAAVALSGAGCVKQPPAAGGGAPPARDAREEKKIIVAKVNGADITLYSLINMVNRMNVINDKTSIVEPPEETRRKALDQLVFRELAIQEAARLGLSVEQMRIDDEMSRFIKSVGHEEGFNDFLAKQKTTSVEVRAQVERNLILQLITTREVAEKATITDGDVRNEYERLKPKLVSPGKVVVADATILLNQEDPSFMKTANALREKMNAGKDRGLGSLVSDGTFTVRSLVLDKNRDAALYGEARKLSEGEISGVIRAGNGVHILQLTQYLPEKQATYEEVKGSLKQGMLASAQVKRFQEWEKELKKEAKIEIMDVPMPPESR